MLYLWILDPRARGARCCTRNGAETTHPEYTRLRRRRLRSRQASAMAQLAHAIRDLPDAPRRALRLQIAGFGPLEQALALRRAPRAVLRDLAAAQRSLNGGRHQK